MQQNVATIRYLWVISASNLMSNKCNFEEWEVNSYSESRTCNSITCHLGELGSILPKNIDKGSLISREGISAYKHSTQH